MMIDVKIRLIFRCFLLHICFVEAFKKLSLSDTLQPLTTPSNSNASPAKPRITIVMFVNSGGVTVPLGPLSSQAIQYAVDVVANSTLLRNYEFAVEGFDDLCVRQPVVKMAIDVAESNAFVPNRLPLVVGPSCSGAVYVPQIIKQYHMISVATGTGVSQIYDLRKVYSHYLIMLPSMQTFYMAIPHFVKSYGWSKVYLLSDTSDYSMLVEYNMRKKMEAMNITLMATAKVAFVTGTIPTSSDVEKGVSELAAYEPRVIIVNTALAPLFACWMHRYHLYGPNYVLIFLGGGSFLPNTPVRFTFCTDKMLYDILLSTIYFWFGHSARENVVDSLGASRDAYDAWLDSRVVNPQISSYYFLQRHLHYDEVIAAAIALDKTEQDLKSLRNETLLDWVTSSNNFQQNGSFFEALLTNNLLALQYSGFYSQVNGSMCSKKGLTGFFQMQLKKQPEVGEDLSQVLDFVAIATFDEQDSIERVERTRFPAKWFTKNGQPPTDSLQILRMKTEIVDPGQMIPLTVISSVLLTSNVILLFMNVATRSSTTMQFCNSAILVGNMLMLVFIFVMPTEAEESAHIHCMVSWLVLVGGLSMVLASLYVKMHVANELPAALSAKEVLKSTASAMNFREQKHTNVDEVFQRTNGLRLIPILIPLFFLVILASWFATQPLKTVVVSFDLQYSKDDISLAIEPYTYSCTFDDTQSAETTKYVFSAFFFASFSILFLREAFLAVLLRKKIVDEVEDLKATCATSSIVSIATIAGTATIAAFYSTPTGRIEIATSVVILAITSLTSGILFGHKFMKMVLTFKNEASGHSSSIAGKQTTTTVAQISRV